MDSGIGAGVDSYFEYLLKGGILFGMPRLIDMFEGKGLTFAASLSIIYVFTYIKYNLGCLIQSIMVKLRST